jgi:hypothetical protein
MAKLRQIRRAIQAELIHATFHQQCGNADEGTLISYQKLLDRPGQMPQNRTHSRASASQSPSQADGVN